MVTRGRRGESGQALPAALLAVLLVGLALALAAAALALRLEAVREEAAAVHLTALADAAIAETLAHLAENPGFRGLSERPLGDGTIASEVERRTFTSWRVTAAARYGDRRRTVRVDVQQTVSGLWLSGWRRLREGR